MSRPATQNAATFATLREIEDRLKSIRNIEKITNTMKIVASTKLTRAQRAMTESRQYGKTSNTVFEHAETKPIEGEGKKTLIVVASSDKGLCGGIHSGLTKRVRKLLVEKPDSDIVVLGEKCKAQLGRSSGKNIVLSFAGIGKDVPTFADAQAIADQISLLPTDYADIQIVYNKFINAQSYEATPIEAFSEEAIANSRKYNINTWPSFKTNDMIKPTSLLSRLTTKFSPTCVNMLWPTPSTGLLLKATPVNNLLVAMPWMYAVPSYPHLLCNELTPYRTPPRMLVI